MLKKGTVVYFSGHYQYIDAVDPVYHLYYLRSMSKNGIDSGWVDREVLETAYGKQLVMEKIKEDQNGGGKS